MYVALTLFIPGLQGMANLCSKPEWWGSLPPHAAITTALIFSCLNVMCAREMGLQYRTVHNCLMICIFKSCDKNGKTFALKSRILEN